MAFAPRTWNCDRESLGGVTRSRFGVKWQNFLRSDGQWQGIDARPSQVGNVLQIANAPYKLEAPLTATGDFRFEATARWDIHRKAGIESAATGLVKRFPGAQPVAAQVDGFLIRYPLAMPSIGADIVIRPHEQKVNFLYEWQVMPVGSGDIECPVEFEFDGIPEVASKSGARNIVTTRDTTMNEPLTWMANSQRGVTIKPAKVWDSLGRSSSVSLRLRRSGNRLVGVKLVPRAFVAKAFADGATWVRTDTTSTFYPDADAESTSVDGHVYKDGPDTWSNLTGAASGDYADDSTASGGGVNLSTTANTDEFQACYRSIFLFDTAAIGDSDTISAATLSLKGHMWSYSLTWNVAVFSANPASNTALGVNDYGSFGSSAYSDNVNLETWQQDTVYNDFAFNGTGLAAITPTGVSKFGVGLYDDLANSPPAWSASVSASAYLTYADETGTGSDPKLVVTHAAAATAQGAARHHYFQQGTM